MKLEKSLNAWKRITNFQGKIYPNTEEFDIAQKNRKLVNTEFATIKEENQRGRKRGQDPSNAKEDQLLRYRVTGERSGKHTFESSDVARVIGGALQDKYLWLVDLSTYYLEIVCKLVNGKQNTINNYFFCHK